MSMRSRMWIGMPALLTLAVTSTAWAQEKSSVAAEVRAAMAAVNTKFANAVKAGDAKAVTALYTDDAVAMPPNAPAMQGHEAIAGLFNAWFTEMTVTDFALTTTEVVPAGDMAVETGTYNMTMKLKSGGDPLTDKGKFIVVWKRGSDGAWKLHRDIWNSDAPAPGAK